VALPVTPGEVVTEGYLYRFIPNLEIYWEYDRDRPSPRAFRRRPTEADVSMYLNGLTTTGCLRIFKPSFGIYAFRVERLLELDGVTVVYDPDHTQPEGGSKVAVNGINRRRAELMAREIGERVNAPDPAVPGL
jgi:hypothetical protein